MPLKSMDEVKNWVRNEKFFQKVKKENKAKDKDDSVLLEEKTWIDAAKNYRFLLSISPLDKSKLLINKSFMKWKSGTAELECIDNEFHMCPYTLNGNEIIWKFNTVISGSNFMKNFNDWRRKKNVDGEGRIYALNIAQEDFEGGRWYDRNEILHRLFNQKDQAKAHQFVKKRMLPIDLVFSHLMDKLKKALKKYDMSENDCVKICDETCRQIKLSLKMLGVPLFSSKQHPGKAYIWYEDFAMIPFIALDSSQFNVPLPWPAIPVNVLLDIQENDCDSAFRLLNQAGLLRSVHHYRNNKIKVIPYYFIRDRYNIDFDSFLLENWIEAYTDDKISDTLFAAINYIEKLCDECNCDKDGDFTKEQQPIEGKLESLFGNWDKHILDILKSEVSKRIEWKKLTWKNISPNCLNEVAHLLQYYPDLVPINGIYQLMVEITYPLFRIPKTNVIEILPIKNHQFWIMDRYKLELERYNGPRDSDQPLGF